MAGNINVVDDPHQGTVPVATDEIGGVHYPVYKTAYGADGSQTPVDEDNPLPVINTPSTSSTGDFLLDVRLGLVTGASIVHKFGRNDAVANGSWEHVSLLSGAPSFLSAATTVRVKAGDVADTAAGAGAREITIQGLDETGTERTEAVDTAGASASASTSTTFIRVYRAWVSSAGTYGAANTAAVIIENTAGTVDLINIAIEEGQTQYAGYTIPLSKTGYLLSGLVTVDGNKTADIKLVTREDILTTSAPVSSVRIKNYWDGVVGSLIFSPKTPGGAISALTDIWIEAKGSGAVAEVSADFELLLIDD